MAIPAIHPGEHLALELEELGMSAWRIAQSEVIVGKSDSHFGIWSTGQLRALKIRLRKVILVRRAKDISGGDKLHT